jgi:hypothetical protein
VRSLSLTGSLRWGKATGEDLPLHDWFFFGGGIQSEAWRSQLVPFPGLSPQSTAGRSVRAVQGGLQVITPSGIAFAGHGAIGNVFDTAVPAASTTYLRGVAVSVSRVFAPGAAMVSIGTRSWKQRPVVELGMGASF